MDVDKAGGDEEAVGVELLASLGNVGADLGDCLVVDGDVSGESWLAGAVDDCAGADDEVVHVVRLLPVGILRA